MLICKSSRGPWAVMKSRANVAKIQDRQCTAEAGACSLTPCLEVMLLANIKRGRHPTFLTAFSELWLTWLCPGRPPGQWVATGGQPGRGVAKVP